MQETNNGEINVAIYRKYHIFYGWAERNKIYKTDGTRNNIYFGGVAIAIKMNWPVA